MPTAIEVVVANVGSHTIDDESTEDGQAWLEAFRVGAETIPGAVRACWAKSDKYDDIAMHFIDYESHWQHNRHNDNDFGGSAIAPPLTHIMRTESTSLYIIYPHTPARHLLYAPQTNVVFFNGIDDEKGPARSDPENNLALGKGGIMISGWRSKAEHDRDVAKDRVVKAYKAMSDSHTVRKTDTWGMQVAIVEKHGSFHKWRNLEGKTTQDWLRGAGGHSSSL